MVELKLISHKDELIHSECLNWDFANPEFDLVEFVDSLAKVMLKNNGIGISASQVGTPYKIFLVAGAGGPGTVKAFINSRIVDASAEKVKLEEGCLTYPGISVKVRRPRTIKLRYQEPNGETKTEKFTGMTARIIQHEMDHGLGITMFDAASILDREKAQKQWKKLQKNTTQF
jgi:peptide deformylase